MSPRRWYTVAGALVLVTAGMVVGISSCAAWAQRERPQVTDAAGVTQSEVMGLPLREQYDLVAARYLEFNELVAEVQREVYTGEWVSVASPTGAMPMPGNAFRGSLAGEETAENSYYLKRFRRIEEFGADETLFRGIKARWESKGWETVMYDSDIYPGNFRVAATTPDGAWIALDILGNAVNLTAYSGVYWGDTEALRTAVWNVHQKELSAGTRWQPPKTDQRGDGLMVPGDYAPFPDWDEIALAPELKDSRT